MNKLLHQLSSREILLEILPSFGLSLLLAEFFYKFGSFTLECLAFLATWYFIGTIFHWLTRSKK